MNTVKLYTGNNSIYEGLRLFAAAKYPPTSKWQSCNDHTCQTMLNTISGLPIGYISPLRIFYRTLVSTMLGKHLLGIEPISSEQAKQMALEDITIHRSTDYSRLLEWKG